MNEALRLFNSGVADPNLYEANKLLDWLRDKGKTKVTLLEIYQYGPTSIRDAKKARQLMAILIDHGFALSLYGGAEFDGQHRKEAFEVRV